jgi:hypothetical protein
VEAYDSDSITIRKAFQQTINKVRVAGGNTPTDCLAGVDIFEAWQDYVDGKSTITVLGAAKANVGFQEISYDGLRIVLDPSLRADTALFVHRPTLIAANLDGNFMRVLEPRPVPETLDYDHPIASILAFGTTSRRSNAKLVWNSAGTLSGS